MKDDVVSTVITVFAPVAAILTGVIAYLTRRTFTKIDTDIVNLNQRISSLEKHSLKTESIMMTREEALTAIKSAHEDMVHRLDDLKSDHTNLRLEFISGIEGCRMDNETLRKEIDSKLTTIGQAIYKLRAK